MTRWTRLGFSDLLLRLAAALLVGGIIGLDRELRGG
jgi:uncharacterized membrane protein YhiD involved in acid resistance